MVLVILSVCDLLAALVKSIRSVPIYQLDIWMPVTKLATFVSRNRSQSCFQFVYYNKMLVGISCARCYFSCLLC